MEEKKPKPTKIEPSKTVPSKPDQIIEAPKEPAQKKGRRSLLSVLCCVFVWISHTLMGKKTWSYSGFNLCKCLSLAILLGFCICLLAMYLMSVCHDVCAM